MNLEGHKTGVGLFIVVALALLVAGIMALGGDKYLHSDKEYVLYFTNTLSGLSVGSPVVLRGVALGSVTRISMVATADGDVSTPVHVRINEKMLRRSGEDDGGEAAEGQEIMHALIIQGGLRAQLQTSSILTGQTRIALDFHKNSKPNFRSGNPMLEIPTIESPIETLQKGLNEVPIQDLLNALKNSLFHINEFLAAKQLESTLASVEAAFTTTNELLQGLRGAPPLVEKVLANLDAVTGTLKDQGPGTAEELRTALRELSQTARQINALAASAEKLVAPDAAMASQLSQLLKDGAAAVRSLRNVADALERNPEAVLRGRQGAY